MKIDGQRAVCILKPVLHGQVFLRPGKSDRVEKEKVTLFPVMVYLLKKLAVPAFQQMLAKEQKNKCFEKLAVPAFQRENTAV